MHANIVQDERWEDLARGTVWFWTLISSPNTRTDSLVCGVAMMAAGETFALHSHEHPEVYFGLEGEADHLHPVSLCLSVPWPITKSKPTIARALSPKPHVQHQLALPATLGAVVGHGRALQAQHRRL